MNEINWYHFFSYSFFFNLILWYNIQLNVHFYIFCQITIYSNGSLADEIWWTFYKRTNLEPGHLENILNMVTISFLLTFELVNCKHIWRIYARVYTFFADDPLVVSVLLIFLIFCVVLCFLFCLFSSCVLSVQYCQCLWIVLSLFPFDFLTFIWT